MEKRMMLVGPRMMSINRIILGIGEVRFYIEKTAVPKGEAASLLKGAGLFWCVNSLFFLLFS